MTAQRIRIVCARALLAATLAGAGSAIAQSLSLQFAGAPASISCSTTGINIGAGTSVSWVLNASSQIQTLITAGGNVVKQKVNPVPTATGTFSLSGLQSFPNPVSMPYTVIYSLTPLVPGAGTSAASFDCVGGAGTNFKLLNSPAFTPTSIVGSLENP